MTVRAQYVVGLVALVALTGAVVWLFKASPTAEPEHEREPLHDQTPAERPVPPPWNLTVRTVDGNGKAVQGKAVVFAGHHVQFPSGDVRDIDNAAVFRRGFLPSTAEGPIDSEPNQTIGFRGTAELSLPPMANVWVRFDGEDGSMALLRAHWRRGASEAGPTVRLGRGQSTVYVMVYGSDWHSPSRAPVRATFNPEGGGPRRDLGTLKPDDGELTITGLDSGTVVLRPETFRPGDGAPFAVAVTVGNRGLRRDGCAILVAPDERREVTIDALVQELPASAPATWLVLERVDQPDGILIRSGQALHEGSQKIPLSLWPGSWRCGVVPTGELTISGAELLQLQGPGAYAFAMHVAPCARRTELSFTGIDPAHLPLRVVAQSVDALSDDDPDRYFGPPQWAGPRASVPALPGATWLVAYGRGANYAATSACTLEGPSVTVAMQKACILTVERREWDGRDPAPEVLTVTIGEANRVASMRPRIVQHGGLCGVVLAAALVLPMGKVMVNGREVVLSKPEQIVAAPLK